ncbi:hypothetical protein ACH5RR_031019 [Cinchona calisaya]|uniref:Uncharacterized protein n=1 Tax=Cinchona calisaya TaxID=153742 RepID=A0ABD2YID9_9GENT
MEMFHSDDQFNLLDVSQKYGPSKGFQFDNDAKMEKQNQLIVNDELEASKDMSSFYPGDFLSNQVYCNTNEGFNFSMHHQEQQVNQLTDFACSDDFSFDVEVPSFQSCEEEIKKIIVDGSEINEAKRERPNYGGASLQLLRNYTGKFRRLHVDKMEILPNYKECSYNNIVTGQKLSPHAILRLAAFNFIKNSSQDQTCVLSHPYASSFCGLSEEDTKAVQLVQYLLAAAEKVSEKQFERASKLLLECDKLSSDQGNNIERLVYYFSGALHERIDRETGTVTPKGLGKMQSLDVLELMSSGLTRDMISMQKSVPFSQVSQFAGIQAILDHVAGATKVHIVDLEIRSGMQYTILMQALATRCQNPLECLKVTAVGTKSKTKLEETGRRLASFAKALNLKFSFKIVMVADILKLNENLFELNADEAVAVWVEYYLMFFIAWQDMLESLMNFIKAINPRIMIVIDVEGNHNSPVFVTRFIESLFHYGGFYDCLEDCLKHDQATRMFVESVYFCQAIRNIIATEGKERTVRHVSVNVWKAFFARFRMAQVELSMSSLDQANLVLKNFDCGSSCTLDMDGKSLIIGWKSTPIHSLSAWKPR